MCKSVICVLFVLAGIVHAGDFQDAFTKRPSFHSHVKNYAIWGDAAILKAVSYDKTVGCKAPGSVKMDAAKLPQGKKASGFIVKALPVKPGNKYTLMFKVNKKAMNSSAKIVARITLGDQKGKSIPDSLFQTLKNPDTFEDGTWQRVLIGVNIPATGRFANAGYATILFGVSGFEKGCVWFDDVEFFAEEK